jgi:uncharacterized protein YbbK (DUF523 family)
MGAARYSGGNGDVVDRWPKPRVVISQCLGFSACRYNGEILRDSFISQFQPFVEYVSICPEMEIGLGVPRDPVRLVSVAGKVRLIQPASGADLSTKMARFAKTFLESVGEVD